MSSPDVKDSALEQKHVLSRLERGMNIIIEKISGLWVRETKRDDITTNGLDPQALRQRMRLIRRWRNGTVTYSTQDIQTLTQFLAIVRRRVLQWELEAMRDDMTKVDEFILILDDTCHHLKDDIEEDLVQVEKDLAHISKSSNNDSNDSLLLHLEQKIIELNRTRDHLLSQVAPLSNSASLDSIQVTVKDKEKFNKVSFETNAERNRVLSIADKIRQMIRLFKEGNHRTVDPSQNDGDASPTDSCAENDIEALRRQLRKMRRWQENVLEFTEDDVKDLQLIVAAISRHLRSKSLSLTDSRGRSVSRQDSTYGTMKTDREDGSVTSEYVSGSAMSSEVDSIQSGCSTENSDMGPRDSLDEDCAFGERLI